MNITSNISANTSKLIMSLLVLGIALHAQAQQGSLYTQYMNDQIPLNPATSLLSQSGQINAIIRKQWTGVPGAPSNFLFDASFPLESINATAGGYINNDQIAIERLTEFNGFFAKSIELADNSFLGVSLNGGLKNYNANYSSLDANDPEFRSDVRRTEPNIGFGIIYYTSNYFIAASAPELSIISLGNASVQQTVGLKNHYNLSGAYLFDNDDDIKWKTEALATYIKGESVVANFSATLYLKNTIGLGANYETDKQIAGVVSFIFPTFRLGYSYQTGTSNNFGGMGVALQEITLSYRFGSSGQTVNLL